MTLVIKCIKDKPYFYFQTHIGVGKIPVTTYITKVQADANTLSEAKLEGLLRHMITLYEENSLLRDVDYSFRHPPSKYDNKTIEYMRALYNFTKQNLADEITDIEQVIFVKYIHTSNALEGNSLTRSEVYDYLIRDKSPYGKSHNELLQTRNHFRVKEYLDNYKGGIDDKLIREIHNRMMAGVDGYDGNDKAGKYRKDMVKVKRGNSAPSKPEDIQKDVNKVLLEYHSMMHNNVHPVNCMAFFHGVFETIHPFRDGNGRTGRAILDHMLKLEEFPPIYIPPLQRENYLNALNECNFENYTPLIDFIIERMKMTFTYLCAKSTMSKTILSDEYRSWFTSNFDPEPYEMMVKGIQDFQTTDDDRM